jgi:predicted nuclease of predicted toxin-antitoxin system
MRILADENIPKGMIAALREAGHEVAAIAEIQPQASDTQVLATAVDQGLVLLTFDADFGRMIFAEGYRAPPGIIYLRSPPPSPAIAIERVLRVARADAPSIDGHFVSIDRKARYHPLPESNDNG